MSGIKGMRVLFAPIRKRGADMREVKTNEK